MRSLNCDLPVGPEQCRNPVPPLLLIDRLICKAHFDNHSTSVLAQECCEISQAESSVTWRSLVTNTFETAPKFE